MFAETPPKLGKGGKKKKSGAARRRRKKERIDASLALFEAEAAENARIGALAVVARVLHKVRNLSKSVIKWNVWFSNEFARWAAQNAAVAAGWARLRYPGGLLSKMAANGHLSARWRDTGCPAYGHVGMRGEGAL